MANLTQRRRENVPGEFYVDASCIDCDTCRWMAPETFWEAGDQSAVHRQPETATERLRAMQALLACPTASIGTVEKPQDVKAVQHSFPILIDQNVYHCGYHSERSYGAASYLILRPEGNILVDSPRFAPPLVERLEELGGIKYLYLTHRDDVADHQKFRERFGCDRILHANEITHSTQDVEVQLQGPGPFHLAPDLVILAMPGHTKGHTVLLYRNQFLFSGDHLAWSNRLQQLYAFRDACWYSWEELTRSMEQLATYPFEWVLPGHGWRYHTDVRLMQIEMQRCLDWMRQQKP